MKRTAISTLIRTTGLGLVGMVAVGLLSLQAPSVSLADDPTARRDEDNPELVLVDDDGDDDDSNDKDTRSRNTGASRATGDNTRSNFTKVSRDRDKSRSDKTRDKTRDGKGGVKRDWLANKTNDRSRNDTRR